MQMAYKVKIFNIISHFENANLNHTKKYQNDENEKQCQHPMLVRMLRNNCSYISEGNIKWYRGLRNCTATFLKTKNGFTV